jgi:hypothetical protein
MKNSFKFAASLVLIAILTTLVVFGAYGAVPVSVLGSSSNYVILAESAITNTGTTTRITGNVGISPDGASSITGFKMTEASSDLFWRSPYVTGDIYTATNAAPTSSTLTTAVTDMTNAYTTLDGLTSTASLPTTLSGNTLATGVYTTPSNVVITTDITLSGTSSATWVFQIAGTLTVDAGVQIVLSGGAQASNVYWVVAGTTALDAGSIMVGNILDATNIAMVTGASITGRLLAQTAVTLESNVVTESVVTVTPTPSPTPTPITSPTPTPTPTTSPIPTPTPTPTPTTSPIPTPTPTPTPTATPTHAPCPTPKPCPTPTRTPCPPCPSKPVSKFPCLYINPRY